MDEKNEIYNLPLASFTFGKELSNVPKNKGNINTLLLMNQNNKNNHSSIKKRNLNLKQLNSIDNNNNQLNINNYYFDNNSQQNNNTSTTKEEICELTFGANNELIKEDKENLQINNNNNNKSNNNIIINNNTLKNKNKNLISLFIDNKGGINDSFISVILYSIHHMKLFRKYIINDLNSQTHKNFEIFQNSFLFNLREILLQMGKNKYIDIYQFKQNLSKQFQNCRKFLIDQPDDPSELLFVIINSIHSYSIQFPLNDISDEACTEKCFSHKFIWLDLSRIDQCKCKGTSKRLFSNHNYITDIPMNKIFNIMNNNTLDKNNEKFLLYESNQKLFNYYTNLISGIKTNCPINGQRCPINKTFHKLHLANSPSYLIFNLEHDFNQIDDSSAYSVINILKSLILIPSKFDIWDLFELNSKKNKNDFEFIGCILFKISKVYSCAFKNKKGLLIYYECENDNNMNNNINNTNNSNNNGIIEFISYFDFVIFCIKNGLIPIMLFYQGSFLSNNNTNNNSGNIVNNYEDFLTKEQIIFLEKISYYTDNLNKIIQIKLRRKENLISFKNIKPNANNNNIIETEYICINCKNKNKSNNKICIKCGYNNSNHIMNSINKKDLRNNNGKFISNNITNNININYSHEKQNLNYSFMSKNRNKIITSQENLNFNNNNNNHMIIQLSKRKKLCVSPDIKHKDIKNILSNYNFETYQNKNKLNYLDLPILYIPKKENKKNILSNISNNKNKNTNLNNNLNKTEININNKNIFISNDIKLNKKMYTSPKVYKTNNLSINSTNDNNINNNVNRHKKILSINNKNKIPLNKQNNIDNNVNNVNNNINNTNKKYETNKNTKKIHLITRTLTSNQEIVRNKLYLNSENYPILIRNKNQNKNQNIPSNVNNNNLPNKNSENKNNFYKNISNKEKDKEIIETEVNEFNELKRKNLGLNNLYINPTIKDKNLNSNYMNYSYNDIQFDKRKNSKKNIYENKTIYQNNNFNYNKRTYNKSKNGGRKIKLNTWICENCSNINSDEDLYCKICRKNKEGELKKIKTPINDKKAKIKININKTNYSFVNNIDINEYQGKNMLNKEINGFNSTKEFRKNKLNKNNSDKNNYNIVNFDRKQNIEDKKENKKNYNNTRGYIYSTYNIE